MYLSTWMDDQIRNVYWFVVVPPSPLCCIKSHHDTNGLFFLETRPQRLYFHHKSTNPRMHERSQKYNLDLEPNRQYQITSRPLYQLQISNSWGPSNYIYSSDLWDISRASTPVNQNEGFNWLKSIQRHYSWNNFSKNHRRVGTWFGLHLEQRFK